MPTVPPSFFGLYDDLNPTGTDSRTISDDQHRNLGGSLKKQCPNWTDVVTATHADVNTIAGLAAAGTKPMPGVGFLTTIYFYNVNTPPPGWSLLVPDAAIRQLVIGDAADGGTIGGTDNPVDQNYGIGTTLVSTAVSIAGATAGHALTVAEMPAHSHPGYNPRPCGSGNTQGWNIVSCGGGAARDDPAQPTGVTGGDLPHDHDSGTLSGTVSNGASQGTLLIQPRYASGILGTLDA